MHAKCKKLEKEPTLLRLFQHMIFNVGCMTFNFEENIPNLNLIGVNLIDKSCAELVSSEGSIQIDYNI